MNGLFMKRKLLLITICFLLIGTVAFAGKQVNMNKQVLLSLKAKAKKGDANSLFALGGLYTQGIMTKKDYKKAAFYFSKAVKRGHKKAMFNLAVMYYDGEGVTKDHKKAIALFNKAAKKGDNKSVIRLADIYYKEKRYIKAFPLYKQAAKAEYPIAQYKIGVMYKNGQGAQKNYKKATKYLTMSSKQSCSEAQYVLGKMYLTGDGIAKNKLKAKTLLQDAYLNGKAQAKAILVKENWDVVAKAATLPQE
jgi:TPR repeat protein